MSQSLRLSGGARAAKKARRWRTTSIASPLAWRSFGLGYEVFGCFEPPPLNDDSGTSALVPLLEDNGLVILILSFVEFDPMYGPAVRCKRFPRSGGCGLASMYPVSDWSSSWLPTIMDISARASSLAVRPQRAMWVTSVRTRREDRSSISSHPLADLGGVNVVRCVIDGSSFEPFLCSCLAAVSFVPACARRRAARKGPSKAGRRAGLASRSLAARPRLDGPERGAMVKLVGTTSHSP